MEGKWKICILQINVLCLFKNPNNFSSYFFTLRAKIISNLIQVVLKYDQTDNYIITEKGRIAGGYVQGALVLQIEADLLIDSGDTF